MSNDLDVAYVVDFFNEDGSKSTHQIFWGRKDAEDYVEKFNGSNRPYEIRKMSDVHHKRRCGWCGKTIYYGLYCANDHAEKADAYLREIRKDRSQA